MNPAWNTRRRRKDERLARISRLVRSGRFEARDAVAILEQLIEPGDRVCLEGNNQKQADFLSRALAGVDPQRVHDLHLLISVIGRPEHIALFERGIASLVDFSYSGPQSLRLAQQVADGRVRVGAIHTYLELFARYFVDLTPDIALIAADEADADGNLYTGPNTEETPTIAEATAFRDGIVIAQVDRMWIDVARVDIPGDWVDWWSSLISRTKSSRSLRAIRADRRRADPHGHARAARRLQAPHRVQSLNHGIGFDTAAIELILPTYGERLGLRGEVLHALGAQSPSHADSRDRERMGAQRTLLRRRARHGTLRCCPSRCVLYRPRRMLRSNVRFASGRPLCDGPVHWIDVADRWRCKLIHRDPGRIAGFGGAPNIGSDPHGRRHASHAWLELRKDLNPTTPGRKLVVQVVETFQKGGARVRRDFGCRRSGQRRRACRSRPS